MIALAVLISAGYLGTQLQPGSALAVPDIGGVRGWVFSLCLSAQRKKAMKGSGVGEEGKEALLGLGLDHAGLCRHTHITQ